ncbi:hypothetical protein TWF694_006300 [Orbilia ellipsospora]|uniref:Uncharacterized protein n=1 Tax=Orbilia ellipsospora TaxID=2528407 RepID=A0AAV9XK56_9PEZI
MLQKESRHYGLVGAIVLLALASHVSAFYMLLLDKGRNNWWLPESRKHPYFLRRYGNYGTCYQFPKQDQGNPVQLKSVDAVVIYNPPSQVPVKAIGFWEDSMCDQTGRRKPDWILQLHAEYPVGIYLFNLRHLNINPPLKAESFRALDLDREINAKDGYLHHENVNKKSTFLYDWPYTMDPATGMVHKENHAKIYPSAGTFGNIPWWLPYQSDENRYLYLRNGAEKMLNPITAKENYIAYGTMMEKNMPLRQVENVKAIAATIGRPLDEIWANPAIHPDIEDLAKLEEALRRTNIQRNPQIETGFLEEPPPSPNILSAIKDATIPQPKENFSVINNMRGLDLIPNEKNWSRQHPTATTASSESLSGDKVTKENPPQSLQKWLETEGINYEGLDFSDLLEDANKHTNNAPSAGKAEEQTNGDSKRSTTAEGVSEPQNLPFLAPSQMQAMISKLSQVIKNLEYRMRNPLPVANLGESSSNPQNLGNRAETALGSQGKMIMADLARSSGMLPDPNDLTAGLRENEALLQRFKVQGGVTPGDGTGLPSELNGDHSFEKSSLDPNYSRTPLREDEAGRGRGQVSQQQPLNSPSHIVFKDGENEDNLDLTTKKVKTEKDNSR